MMEFLTQLIAWITGFFAQLLTWINVPVNFLGSFGLGFIAYIPGWLSNTIISGVVGVLALFILKYTSNQDAIGRAKDCTKANMLALKLFKDSFTVTMKSLGQIYKGAFIRLFHIIRPMLVMTVPFCLVMSQMGLWYQARPLLPGEEAVVTMQLNGDTDSEWPDVSIVSDPAFDITIEKVRVFSKRLIYWKIKALEEGLGDLIFEVGADRIKKELVIGAGLTKVSIKRPGRHFEEILLNPWEKPFTKDSAVQSINIEYPDRISKTCGTNWWIGYFFVVSMVFAFLLMPFVKVKI